jgi:hypothetical protein
VELSELPHLVVLHVLTTTTALQDLVTLKSVLLVQLEQLLLQSTCGTVKTPLLVKYPQAGEKTTLWLLRRVTCTLEKSPTLRNSLALPALTEMLLISSSGRTLLPLQQLVRYVLRDTPALRELLI